MLLGICIIVLQPEFQTQCSEYFGYVKQDTIALHCYNQNVRGLRTKLKELSQNISLSDHDVLIFTESWLLSVVTDGELGLEQFTVYRKDKSEVTSSYARGGGVLFAMRNYIPSQLLKAPNRNVEDLFVSLCVKNQIYVFGICYIPPGSNVEVFGLHCQNVELIVDKFPSASFYINGDYNLPGVLWLDGKLGCQAAGTLTDNARLLFDSFAFLNIHQVNQIGNAHDVSLDLVFTSSLCLEVEIVSDILLQCDAHHPTFTYEICLDDRPHTMVDAATVRCREDNKTIVSLSEKYLCYRDKENLLISMIVIISTLLFLVTLAAVYFTYRREIKIWLFAKNLCLWLITEDELDEDKKYDAFVSYSHKDEDFVENFVEILENCPQPYKLCLHYRDWIPGKYIAEQIVDSVNDSKRTIIILSNNFLESVWAKMEFQTAHIQAMKERKAKVIIVLYGDIDMETLDEDLKLYMKTNTYVKWGDPWFWNKLRYGLPHENKKRQRNAQKHANMMMTIENKFTVSHQPLSNGLNTGNQVFSLDAESLMKHSLSLKAKKDLQKNKAS